MNSNNFKLNIVGNPTNKENRLYQTPEDVERNVKRAFDKRQRRLERNRRNLPKKV